MSIKKTKKMLKQYGFNYVKAVKLHKTIEHLDEQCQEITNNMELWSINRTKCWALTQKLIKLEITK